MSTDDNSTMGGEDGEEKEESFHIYILSFSYGFLLLIILGHLLVRWQWRRVKVAKSPRHFPGDKSFKCKAIRQRLCADFAAISKLSPDPTLINPNYEPQTYGPCKGDGALPSHWYRMKTCEVAAAFVSANKNLLQSSPPSSSCTVSSPCERHNMPQALPGFVASLREGGVLAEGEECVTRLCDLYTTARYEDGEYPERKFTEFTECLQQLHQLLSLPNPVTPVIPATAPPSQFPADFNVSLSPPRLDYSTTSDPLLMRDRSMDPLLVSSMSESFSPPPQAPPPPRQTRPCDGNGSELSPLITIQSPSYREDSYLVPETPL